jgi:hypothetical protein
VGAIHNFKDSLAMSHRHADETWWKQVYERAFPTLRSAVDIRDDGWAQRGGIDRVLTLDCGRVYRVDEKVRKEDWPDVLIEYWSNHGKKIPGWAFKPLACDFIAYAFVPSRTCYLFPTSTLQRAARLNKQKWWDSYQHVRADNGSYTTVSVAVPKSVLRQAISDAMVIYWSGDGE